MYILYTCVCFRHSLPLYHREFQPHSIHPGFSPALFQMYFKKYHNNMRLYLRRYIFVLY